MAGRYLLGAEIGRGGMSVVYRGWDTVLQREVAVKMLRDLLLDPAAQRRFEAEGRILARLDHPGLVPVYDSGLLDDRPFLVFQLVDGETLSQRRRRGPMPVTETLAMAIELAGVLGHIHALGIAHRDVTPGNILIDAKNRFRLADFGLARSADSSRHTAPGMTIGTAAYMSPEQVRGQDHGAPGDIYALGLIMIEALTGEVLYQGAPEATALARLVTPPASLVQLPGPIHHLVTAMTAQSPQHRPAAAEVLAQLRALSEHPELVSIAAQPGTSPATRTMEVTEPAQNQALGSQPVVAITKPSGRPGRRWRWLLAAAAVLVLVPALAAGHLLGTGRPPAGQVQGGDPAPTPSAGTSPARSATGAGPGSAAPPGQLGTTAATAPSPAVIPSTTGAAAGTDDADAGNGKHKGKGKNKAKKGGAGKGND